MLSDNVWIIILNSYHMMPSASQLSLARCYKSSTSLYISVVDILDILFLGDV